MNTLFINNKIAFLNKQSWIMTDKPISQDTLKAIYDFK